MKLSGKKVTGFVAGVIALSLAVGSWAYYSATTNIENNMQTREYGGETVEYFPAPPALQPGSKVVKEVGVKNTGDYDLIVRIKMDEVWWDDANGNGKYDTGDTARIQFTSSQDEFKSVTRTGTDPDYAYDAAQVDNADGDVTGDQTVMYKEIDLTDWVLSGGYWYYKYNLTPGSETGALMKYIVLADDTDMGKYVQDVSYYSTADKDDIDKAQDDLDDAIASGVQTDIDAAQAALTAAYNWQVIPAAGLPASYTYLKSESTIDPDHPGYAGANYQLKITTQICQANLDALKAAWGSAFTVPADTNWTLA